MAVAQPTVTLNGVGLPVTFAGLAGRTDWRVRDFGDRSEQCAAGIECAANHHARRTVADGERPRGELNTWRTWSSEIKSPGKRHIGNRKTGEMTMRLYRIFGVCALGLMDWRRARWRRSGSSAAAWAAAFILRATSATAPPRPAPGSAPMSRAVSGWDKILPTNGAAKSATTINWAISRWSAAPPRPP